MVIQIIGDKPEKDVKQWLNYLGLILPSKQQEEEDKDILNKILEVILHDINKLNEIWGEQQSKEEEEEKQEKQPIKQVIKDETFTYQAETNLNCFETCKKILKNAGIENSATEKIHMVCSINKVNGKTNYEFHPECLQKGIEVLDEFLEKGQPVIVGVDYRDDYDINEGVTDHYIVVVARGNDEKGVYYRYFEVFRSVEDGGISKDINKLHFNPKGYLEGPCTCNNQYEKYIVTIVRPNGKYNFNCCNMTDYTDDQKKNCNYLNSENQNCSKSIKP